MLTHWIHAAPQSLTQRLFVTASGKSLRRLEFSTANIEIGRSITGHKEAPLTLTGEIIPSESLEQEQRNILGLGSIEFLDLTTFNSSGPSTLSTVLFLKEDMFSFIWNQACSTSLIPFIISLDFEPSAANAQVAFEAEWNVSIEPKVRVTEVRISRTVSLKT